jgi:hypothetical protein
MKRSGFEAFKNPEDEDEQEEIIEEEFTNKKEKFTTKKTHMDLPVPNGY